MPLLRLNFAPNITKRNTRWPPTLPWDTVCAARGAIDSSPRIPLLGQLLAEADHAALANTLASRLLKDLTDRKVLCDANAACTVRVLRRPELAVEVCLPPRNVSAPAPVVCEPYGEMWQQLGGEASRFNSRSTTRYKLLGSRKLREAFEHAVAHGLPEGVTSLPLEKEIGDHIDNGGTGVERPGCARFDLRRISTWLDQLRARQPFVGHATLAAIVNTSASLLDGKSKTGRGGARRGVGRGARASRRAGRETTTDERRYIDDFQRWMRTSPSALHAARFRAKQFKTCAVVGSGHDLRCGPPRGREIDAHDAVFRSNAAQHRLDEHGFDAPTKRESALLRRELKAHRVDDWRGGRRTTFRVNGLFASKAVLPRPVMSSSGGGGGDDGGASRTLSRAHEGTAAATTPREETLETCIIARSWFHQPWGKEGFNNARHTCCTTKSTLRSSYNLSVLQDLERLGARFAFFDGKQSGDQSIDAMLAGSGGNALHAALAMCEHVNIYGAGLFASGVDSDKVYAHAYDERVGTCLERGSRVYEFGNTKGLAGFFAWRRDRVRTEILMHVLHALGVVRWVQ